MTKAKWFVVAGLVSVGTVWGLAAAAQGPGGHGARSGPGFGGQIEFSVLDADGDGQITVAEVKAAEAGRFAEMDADGDGSVTADELSAQSMAKIQERMANRFERMLEWRDSDGDGALSQDELSNGMAERMFSRLDRDKDGSVSEDEFNKAKGDRRGDGRGERRGGHGQRGG